MKRTILSEKESRLIETILAEYGVVVTFQQIRKLLQNKISRQSVKNLVNKLCGNGWLVRIKKGSYAVASLESRGFTTIPTCKIAQILLRDSYVSFEAALQQRNMFDQQLKAVVSVGRKRYPTKEIQGIKYSFILTKKELFYGWQEERIENYVVKIATAEKALLDMLCFNRSLYAIDLVAEKLRDYKDSLDLSRLQQMCQKQSMTVRRIVGFLLDKLAIDSRYLHRLVRSARNSSYMTKDSKKFNAKWRLYYHHRFDALR
jgi:predicted transcriptional regulator of viral defense system